MSKDFKVVNLIERDDTTLERSRIEKSGYIYIDSPVPKNTSAKIIETAIDADALIDGGQLITQEVIEKLTKLKIVSLIGVGFDEVDVKAATKNGVLVTHNPDIITDQVADHSVALILSLNRMVPKANEMVKNGIWETRMQMWAKPVQRLKGSTAGIIGFGRTGKAVALRLKSFGINILAYDPYVKPDPKMEVTYTNTIEELLEKSDIVAIHTFFTEENRHMINEEKLKKMKKNAYIVNTSRGALIDEKALYKALVNGWISGAALDVFEQEPPNPHNPLFKLDNFIATPHCAYYSDESVIDQRLRTVEEVIRALSGNPPLHAVNPEVLQTKAWRERALL